MAEIEALVRDVAERMIVVERVAAQSAAAGDKRSHSIDQQLAEMTERYTAIGIKVSELERHDAAANLRLKAVEERTLRDSGRIDAIEAALGDLWAAAKVTAEAPEEGPHG